jgi:hypothetical protein
LGIVLAALFGAASDAVSSGDLQRVHRAIQDLQRLTEDEKVYLRSLVAANGHGPLDHDDIVRSCREIIDHLERPASLRIGDHLGVVVALRTRQGPTGLAKWIAETDPKITATDEIALRQWIEEDLADAEVISSGVAEPRSYFLKGRRLPYRLFQFKHLLGDGEHELTWNLGNLSKADFIDERRVSRRAFSVARVLRVYTVQVANSSYPEICKTVRPWESILPSLPEPDEEPHSQIRFLRRFLEVTNEIERAIRETEIYPIVTIKTWFEGNHEYIIAEEDDRTDTLPMLDGNTPSMVSYLSNEDAQSQKIMEIYIGSSAALKFDQWIEPAEFWTLHKLPPSTPVQPGTLIQPHTLVQLGPKQVMLRRFTRPSGQTLSPPPSTGFLRIRGMFAQVKLIDRREEAIDLVATHTFLQRALVLPDTVYMDTGIEELPLPIPPVDKFDLSKSDALKQTWRTRPIYYLQGPPGTGKTTLVGQLLRQIYGDDPSCQVLLTAQAHSAVDHLRNEVSKFVTASQKDQPSWLAPLAVRLRKPKPDEVEPEIQDPAYPSSVARQILDHSIQELERRVDPPEYIREWLAYARSPSDDGDFEQLVRRSANFV